MNNTTEIPVLISDEEVHLYAMHRCAPQSGVLVVQLPFIAMGGTREGTQRLFVELGRALLACNISSVSVDLPPFSDSYYKQPVTDGAAFELLQYEFFIDKIIRFFDRHYSYREYVLLSISAGCIPVFNYARHKGHKRVILFSLHDYAPDIAGAAPEYMRGVLLRTKNYIRQYDALYRKFGLEPYNNGLDQPLPLDMLCIFGEKDPQLEASRVFLARCLADTPQLRLREEIIGDANHSFFAWTFKQQIIRVVTQWMQR